MPKNNLFTRLALGATMAEAPAVMTAAGWTSDPVNGVQVGDPNAPGNEELRKALFEIGKASLIDMGAELALPAVLRGASSINKVIKISPKELKNFLSSRSHMRALNKALDSASNSADVEAARRAINQGAHTSQGDITGFTAYKNEVESAKVDGNKLIVKYKEARKPDITQFPSPKAAEEAKNYALSHQTTTIDINKKIADTAKELNSGNQVSLINDFDLSKDSYPIYQAYLRRNHMNGIGKMEAVKDGNTYRMIRLNPDGINPQGLSNVDRQIDEVRTLLKDPNIPGRTTIAGTTYVPATKITKFDAGGFLKKMYKIYGGDMNKIKQAISSTMASKRMSF